MGETPRVPVHSGDGRELVASSGEDGVQGDLGSPAWPLALWVTLGRVLSDKMRGVALSLLPTPTYVSGFNVSDSDLLPPPSYAKTLSILYQ